MIIINPINAALFEEPQPQSQHQPQPEEHNKQKQTQIQEMAMESLNKEQPGPNDVWCARGKRAFNHPGNRRFRKLVESKMEEYSAATSKLEKSLIVSAIIDGVRNAVPPGGFLREEECRANNGTGPSSSTWIEVGDAVAREKVGQGFRDLLHTKYKSSTKAKKRRRVQMARQASEDTTTTTTAISMTPLSVTNATPSAPPPQTQSHDDGLLAPPMGLPPSQQVDECSLEKLFQSANNATLGKIKRGSVVQVLQGLLPASSSSSSSSPSQHEQRASILEPIPFFGRAPAQEHRSSTVEPVALDQVFRRSMEDKNFRSSFLADLNDLIGWDEADISLSSTSTSTSKTNPNSSNANTNALDDNNDDDVHMAEV